MPTKYIVQIEYDQDVDSPAKEECQWRIYSFNSRHASFRHPDNFFDEQGRPKLWLRPKLRVGLAHILSYYEHSNCVWSLQGSGPQCRFDSVQVAGVAVWEDSPSAIGGKTIQERATDCAGFLEYYTDWCNGNCYWFNIKTVGDEKEIASCGGFIGEESVTEIISSEMPDDATEENTEIEGDASWIVNFHDIFPKQTAQVSG